MITEKQAHDCSLALIEWFKSQDCKPADGSQVMLKLIANQLVHKTTDLNELQKAIRDLSLVLTLEVALVLKAMGKV